MCASVEALGPLVRALFGVPAGFNEDFLSHAAYAQARFVQAISVGIGFLMFGGAIGTKAKRIGFRQAVWVVNPITVGVGFAAYKRIYHSLRRPDYLPEYDSPAIFALFVITAPLLFVSFRRSLSAGSVSEESPMSVMAIYRQLTGLLSNVSLQNADLGEHTFFPFETPRTQNHEECDLCPKARSAVEGHIAEGTGP